MARVNHVSTVKHDDPINHPKHYTNGSIECIDYLIDQHFGFFSSTVVKYITRYRTKNGVEDLKKAQWYLNRLIKELEAGNSVD